MSKKENTEKQELSTVNEEKQYVPFDITTFEELDKFNEAFMEKIALEEQVYNFRNIALNIIDGMYDVNQKPGMLRKLSDQFAERIKGITDGVSEFFKGSPENKENKEIGVDNDFVVFKQNGEYRWQATFTNKYRDREQEILSSNAHKNFVSLVDAGVVSMPVLRHWHIKGTEWGEADMLAYDEETGFMLAVGKVYPGCEEEAESLIAIGKESKLATSHGMPVVNIVRDKENPLIIEEYISEEISDLPLWAAANSLSDFTILNKEVNMSIPNTKKDYLRKIGYSDEKIESLENSMKEKAENAMNANLDFKENSETESVVETETEAVDEKETADVEVEETSVDEDTQKEADENTSDAIVEDREKEDAEKNNKENEIVQQIQKEIAEPIGEALKSISQSVADLAKRVNEIEKEHEKGKEVSEKALSMTSPASLASMISKSIIASASDETVIRKNSVLAKDTPEEVETTDNEKKIIYSGNPVIDNALSGIIK